MQDPRQYAINGPVLTNVYDSSGRVTSQTDSMNRTTTFSYVQNADGTQTTTITDPNGNVTIELYQNNVLLSLTKGYGTPQAATWSYAYDAQTLGITSVTDPRGHVWKNTWDWNGNLLTSTDPLGRTTSYTYDGLNDVVSVTDGNGVKTALTYDSKGNLLTVSRPLTGTSQTATTTYAYGDAAHPGDVTAISDPDGTAHTTNYSYDATTGNLLSVTDALGNKTTFGYDAAGRVTSQVSPRGNVSGGNPSAFTTTYTYDAFGDVTSVTDPLQHQTIYTYDPDQNLQTVKDARGNTTTYLYNADNEVTSVQRPDTTTQGFAYDGDGNVLAQTDGLTQTTTYTYDPLNRLISQADPLGRKTTYAYDAVGNMTTLVNAKGNATGGNVAANTTTYGYDAANQLTSMSYGDGTTHNVTFAYDNDGQRTSMTDGTGTSSYTYDSLNRLTQSKNGAGQTVNYGYDLAGNLTSLTYPGGSQVTRSYDNDNRLSQVTDWLRNSTAFAYDPDSSLLTQTYPNSTTANFTYDNADELTQIVDKKGTTALWAFGYSRDQDGQLASASDPIANVSHTYAYDSLNRFASDARSSGTGTWSYNAADELTGTGDTGTDVTTTLTHDIAHELTVFKKTTGSTVNQNLSIGYNANGDRTSQTDSVSGTTTSFGYDLADRLTSFTKGSAASTYAYNGDGLRASKTVSGKSEGFVWDLAEGLPLLLQDGSTSYVTGPGGLPLEQINGTKAYFYYQDELGSTRAMLDGKASTVATYVYDPYGNLTGSTGSVVNPFQYAGQYTDSESGLQYLRTRYYDPATQAFLTVDPLTSVTGQPYSYGRSNPLNGLDPSGLDCSFPGLALPFGSHRGCVQQAAGAGGRRSRPPCAAGMERAHGWVK